jgi:glucose/arabinose dehydrogenase
MAFLGPDDFFVLEKASGQVKRVQNGSVVPVLDLAVNSASERGLLGIALSPEFDSDSSVYLYWTESSTGADSTAVAETPLLGNRVDRFLWNGSTLSFDRNIIHLRALQADDGQPLRGNHDGGVIRFGPDGQLYVVVGDVGRRGQLQNLSDGPFGPGNPDDQFGGPEPDNAHLTGTVLRLNSDGSAAADNPFFAVGAAVGGEIGANLQRVFAYGIRNSFGMDFDPISGQLWMAENADDAFDEVNRVEPGMNGGWVQIMGPVDRIAEFKDIEVNEFGGSLQQIRWPPTLIADTPEDAVSRLFMLPGASYSDPEFSWKYAVAPAAVGFQEGNALGAKYNGNMFVGAARDFLDDGYLFRFVLDGARDEILASDPGLSDRVADNSAKFDVTESESLRFGTGFGITTDIHTGPNGNLFVVSLSHGQIYEISRIPEPTTLALLGIGLSAFLWLRPRFMRRAPPVRCSARHPR